MATQIVPAPACADDAALPQPARDAMRRLELALAAPAVVRAVTRYEIASAHCRSLSVDPAADYDELLCIQDEMAMCRCKLAAAGRLDLIEVAR